MSNLVAVLPAILLVFQGLPVPSSGDPVWHMQLLMKLDDALTNKIKKTMEELEDSSILEAKEIYNSLKYTAELPFLQLDEKITAFNNYEKVYGARKNPELESDADNTAELTPNSNVQQRTIFSFLFEAKLSLIFGVLGLIGSFSSRVWNALLCDRKKAKKVKHIVEMTDSSKIFHCKKKYHKKPSKDCKEIEDIITGIYDD